MAERKGPKEKEQMTKQRSTKHIKTKDRATERH